jgi:hypothetical protein
LLFIFKKQTKKNKTNNNKTKKKPTKTPKQTAYSRQEKEKSATMIYGLGKYE